MKAPPRLVAFWYARLRAEGFEDIEDLSGNLRASDQQRQSDAEASWEDRVAGEAYYRAALRFMHTPRYRDLPTKRRRAWALHATGASNTQIAEQLHITLKAVRVTLTACRRMAGLPRVGSTLGHGRRSA